mmetsp:Transcript_32893/g.49643  ORF Transcript_32893/g.49643 Transcript_32893/m.49643 type:complete len:90 (-) Transcript_32893:3480-3749(-)
MLMGQNRRSTRIRVRLELREIKKSSNITGSCTISLVGSHKHPGFFFEGPVGKMTYAWACVLKQKNSPKANQTDDLEVERFSQRKPNVMN